VGRSVPAQAASIAHVELRLAGTFGVVRDGRQLAGREIGSRKSRTLLKLLAVERPALVPVDRIIDVLWSAHPPAAAEQNVASLVSRLRGVLGPGVIPGGRHGYRLADGSRVSVDLDAAAAASAHRQSCSRRNTRIPGSPARTITRGRSSWRASGPAMRGSPTG
jgi:DNA-binding SARP family transcriptional activator